MEAAMKSLPEVQPWFDHCDTCGCELTYPLEVQEDCRYPDCENCHQSETASRAADGDR